jgi:hypothetical protein
MSIERAFIKRVAALKSIAEGAETYNILNSYNELVSEARRLLDLPDPWWDRPTDNPVVAP